MWKNKERKLKPKRGRKKFFFLKLEMNELEISGKKINITYSDTNRIGDHIWYISDVSKFKNQYPEWNWKYNLQDTLEQIFSSIKQRVWENLLLLKAIYLSWLINLLTFISYWFVISPHWFSSSLICRLLILIPKEISLLTDK